MNTTTLLALNNETIAYELNITPQGDSGMDIVTLLMCVAGGIIVLCIVFYVIYHFFCSKRSDTQSNLIV